MTRRACPTWVFLVSLQFLFFSPGCSRHVTSFQVESFKHPVSQVYSEQFENGVYALNSHHNWDLVFEVPAAWTPTTQPASSQSAAVADQNTWYSQLLHIKVFWTPEPGDTYAESTQTNAAIRYYLFMGTEIMTYEGAGFVYFHPPRQGEQFTGRIESASLHPAQKTSAANDLFGPCRLSGEFAANENLRQVRTKLQQARRNLVSKSAPAK